MAVQQVGQGMWLFTPETDPEKIEKSKRNIEEWKKRFDQIKMAMDQHGWDSPECQIARIEMDLWQRERRKNDQTDNT